MKAGASRLFWAAFFCAWVLALEAQEWIIPTGSDWRFRKGTNEASSPITLWRERTFNDTSWLLAAAPFHYGDGLTTGTALPDMRRNYSCIYLRREFVITNVAEIQSMILSVDYDDGFIAWINGYEVALSGAPVQPLFNAVASLSHEGGSAVIFTPLREPASFLVAGTNVLAVQAFNVNLSSSTDFRFEAAVGITRTDGKAPEVANYNPPGPRVGSLRQIQVVFTEAVLGVQASDLWINDQPAVSVTGGPMSDRFTFYFTQPSPGPVDVSWSEGQRIIDPQGNPFNTEASSSSWHYVLEDTVPPIVGEQTPATGALVGRLTEVEVTFSEPVTGLDAADLQINGQAAGSVTGAEAGPYHFTFSQPSGGNAQFTWKEGHGIRDYSGNLFAGGSWMVILNPGLAVSDVRINEFAAANETGLKDEDGESEDWIELYNAGSTAVNLLGWSLTDDQDLPGKWVFPNYVLHPGACLVVFASGKDRRAPSGDRRFHTNFKLNAFGEYLALFNAEFPRAAVSEFASKYPEQRNDHSYGLETGDTWRYFALPTPGILNGTSTILGIAPAPQFSIGRGLFNQPCEVSLTSPLEGATIRYTTDGSDPARGGGTAYTQPLRITVTTTLRAAVFMTGYLPSRTRTESYIFLDTVIDQPADPPGFPASWGSWSGFPNNQVTADYAMDIDPLRVDPENPGSAIDPVKLQRLRNGLRQLPIVSVVMDQNDLFGAGGLYPSASDSNKSSNEKACSVEMILPDGSTAFAVQGGLDLHGNASRSPLKNPKHGFKLKFKGDYGETALDYRLFPDSPAERFDDLILRPDFNSSWRHWSDSAGNGNGAFQRSRGTRTRFAWSQETFRDLGHTGSHVRYFHLFLNGLYWGTYDFTEQPTAHFAQTYYGGADVSHDIYDQGSLREGTSAVYNALSEISGLALHENYERIKQYLDVTEFIDYMLLHFYIGHQDWGANKNWYALRPRVEASMGTPSGWPAAPGRFKYLPWDQECILLDENVSRVPNGGGGSDVPSGLHTKLDDNAEYRLEFADRVFKHMIAPGGALTPEANIARWLRWQAILDEPIVAESCRWGDYRRDVHRYSEGVFSLYTREDHWMKENHRLVNSYFVNRGSIVLNQLKSAGLYPTVEAPLFNQPGGIVLSGFELAVTAPSGSIYVTTNESDPRLYGTGAISPHAMLYTSPIKLDRTTRVKARVYQAGSWSALHEAVFTVGQPGAPLRFTEIMYHPPSGNSGEFVELQNIGPVSIEIGGFSLQGVEYIFPDGTIVPPGAVLLLRSASDPTAFRARYPLAAVFGAFQGSLDNGGERLALIDRQGRTVTEVRYDDENGWPREADGGGRSLEVIDPRGNPNDPSQWRASANALGTPGLPPSPSQDTDGDGLPDDWEKANGTDPMVADAEADPDRDRMSNLEEYRAGTDPRSSASALQLRIMVVQPDRVTFQFQAIRNHSYSVLYSDSLNGGTWRKVADEPAGNSDRPATLSDSSPPPTSRYYRLVTPASSTLPE